MRRVVFPVACFCGLGTAPSAQPVQHPSETCIASWYGCAMDECASAPLNDSAKVSRCRVKLSPCESGKFSAASR